MASGKTSGLSGQPWKGVDVASRGKSGMHWLKSHEILDALDKKGQIFWNSAGIPAKELDALKDRAMKSGFDFIDFWAVDFDWHKGKPFEHNWQDFRTRKDRTLKTVSDFGYDKYPEKGKYTACIKVIDVFGCDTSITAEINI